MRRNGTRMAGYTFRGEVARDLRTRRGIRTADAAERLGVTAGHLANVESGQFQPSAILYYRICELLGAEVDDLRTPDAEPVEGAA